MDTSVYLKKKKKTQFLIFKATLSPSILFLFHTTIIKHFLAYLIQYSIIFSNFALSSSVYCWFIKQGHRIQEPNHYSRSHLKGVHALSPSICIPLLD